MADEDDTEFLTYLERNLGKCNPLKEMIKTEIAEALKSQPPSPSPPKSGEGQQNTSLTYLERLNEKLMARLLKEEKDAPLSIPAEQASAPVPEPPKPEAKKAFWK